MTQRNAYGAAASDHVMRNVRDHFDTLREAHWSLEAIARALGFSRQSLSAARSGKYGLSETRAQAILSLDPASAKPPGARAPQGLLIMVPCLGCGTPYKRRGRNPYGYCTRACFGTVLKRRAAAAHTERDQLIVAMYQDSRNSVAQICEAAACTTVTVYRVLRVNDVSYRQPGNAKVR